MDWSTIYGGNLFMQNMFPEYEMDSLGCGGIGGGMGNIWGGGFGMGYQNMDQMIAYQKSMFKANSEMEDLADERKLEKFRKEQKLKSETNAAESVVADSVGNIIDAIQKNDQAQIPGTINEAKEAIKAKYAESGYTPSDAVIEAELKQYFKDTTGTSLTQAVGESGQSPFTHGLLFLYNKTLGSEQTGYKTEAALRNKEVSKSDQNWEKAGQITGGAVMTLAALAALRRGPGAIRDTHYFLKESRLASKSTKLESALTRLKTVTTQANAPDLGTNIAKLEGKLESIKERLANVQANRAMANARWA